MPRPREFDPDTVLDRIVEVFWRKGYSGTSINDIERATSVNRASLYAVFGDKESLFLAALERYAERFNGHLMAALAAPGSGRAAIREYFDRLIRQLADPQLPQGCLVANGVVECGADREAVARQIAHKLAGIETQFYRTLRQAQQTGDIDETRDARALARFLTATAQGMAVIARANADETALRDVAEAAMTVLDDTPRPLGDPEASQSAHA